MPHCRSLTATTWARGKRFSSLQRREELCSFYERNVIGWPNASLQKRFGMMTILSVALVTWLFLNIAFVTTRILVTRERRRRIGQVLAFVPRERWAHKESA